MPFNSCRVLRWGCSLALAPKKSVALQAGWVLSPDVALVSDRSGADVVALSDGQASPTVAPMLLVGQEDAGVGGVPLGVIKQTATNVILPPTSERMELPPTLVVTSVVGTAPQAEAPASQVEVATTVTS